MRRILLAVVVFLLFWPLTATAEPVVKPDNKVAKVGNLVIKQEEVDRRLQKLLPMAQSFHGGVSAEKVAEIKQQALEEVIERAYKVQYAINEEISVNGKEFEEEWQKRVDGDPRLRDPKLAAQVGAFKADLYLDALAQKAETVAVDEKVKVTDQEVKASYDENKSMYYRPKLYTVSHVFIKVDPASNAEELAVLKARAEELYKRAIDGEDFYDLAYYESDDRTKYVGGVLGTFHSGQMIAELDSVVVEMQVEEIAGPIRSRHGFHVVRLDVLDEERQLEFDEVEIKIRERMKTAARNKLYDQWMSELKEKYVVEYFD